jgi:hypothetical protein
MSDHCARCVLCNAEAENVPLSTPVISALRRKTEASRTWRRWLLWSRITREPQLLQSESHARWRTNEKTRLHLLLATYEEPVKRMKKRASKQERWRMTMIAMMTKWLWAARRVGWVCGSTRGGSSRSWLPGSTMAQACCTGAPMLGRTGVKIVVGNLRPDERGRTYAGRAPVVQIEIGRW